MSPTWWRAAQAAIFVTAASTIVLLSLARADERVSSVLVVAALAFVAMGVLALVIGVLTAGRRGPSHIQDVARALKRGRCGWRGAFSRAIAEDLNGDTWPNYFFGVGPADQSVEELAGRTAASREQLRDASAVDVEAAAQRKLDFYTDRQSELVQWAQGRFQQTALDMSRRWTVLSSVLVILALVGAVWVVKPIAGRQESVLSLDGEWTGRIQSGPDVLRTVVDVQLPKDGGSSAKAFEKCPGLDSTQDIKVQGFLLRSDDSDGHQDGPFSVLVTDYRCAGEVLTVGAGNGHYTTPGTVNQLNAVPSPAGSASPSPSPSNNSPWAVP